MNTIIKKLRNKSMQTHCYSDCDGDNNYGVELNELQFAKLIIAECTKLNNQFIGHRIGEIDLELIYNEHFGIKQ